MLRGPAGRAILARAIGFVDPARLSAGRPWNGTNGMRSERKRIIAGILLAAAALGLIAAGLRARILVFNSLDEFAPPEEISDRLMVRWATQAGMSQRDGSFWVEGSPVDDIEQAPCPT